MFAVSEGETLARLGALFAHYVKLGQWEAARATVRQVHCRSPARAHELLRDVAARASAPAALVWQASCELAALGGTAVEAAQGAALDMAVRACKELASRDQGRVLDRLRQLSGGNDGLKKLSAAEQGKLREVLALFPLLGSCLISSFPQGQLQLYLDIMHDLLSRGHLSEALSFVPFLQAANLTAKETRALDALLEKLHGAAGSSFAVYQALLGAPECATVLERFGMLEDAAAKSDYREAVPSVFRETDKARFWHALHAMALVAGKHFFEIVAEKALLAAQEGRYADCALLLRHFQLLKPLVMAMIASKGPSFGQQHSLLEALNLSSWKIEAASWCATQPALKMSVDAALQQLEAGRSLVDLVGAGLGLIDRNSFLALLQHHPHDRQQCLEFFALKDVLDGKATTHVWLNQMEDASERRRVAVQCLKAGAAAAASVQEFRQLVASITSSFEQRHEAAPEELIDAEFRLLAAERLRSPWPLTDAGVQILSDAAMAGDWDLCRDTVARFAFEGNESCAGVVSFAAREEEMDRRRRVTNESDYLALADLAFITADAAASIALLEKACAASKDEDAAVHTLLSQTFVVARGRGLPLKSVLVMSRDFPDDVTALLAFVNRENRIQEMTNDVDGQSEALIRELGEEAPLSVFLRYRAALHRAGFSGLSVSPEDALSTLVARGDAVLAESLSRMLRIKLVEALIAREGLISLPELEYIAQSDPLLAARVALQRQGETCRQELLDFAEAHAGSSAAVLKTIASCRIYAQVNDGSIPWSLWADPLEFHRRLIDRLFEVSRFEDALELADEHLPEGPSDAILAGLARRGGSECWRFVTRCADRHLAAELALALRHEFELVDAIDVLEMSVHCGRQDLETQSLSKLKLMRAYQQILRHRNVFGPWRTWQELDRACTENPDLVMKQLLEWKQFDLAKMIGECVGAPANLDIDADALLHLLEHGGDDESVSFFLQTLKEPRATAQAVLQVCRVPEARLVLWKFLGEQQRLVGARALTLLPASVGEEASAGPPRSASRARRGLFNSTEALSGANTGSGSGPMSMMMSAKKSLRSTLLHLEQFPHAIVESLIMNEKISELAVIFKAMPTLINDEKIILYARKALAFDWAVREGKDATAAVATNASASSEGGSSGGEEMIVLTGDEIQDMATRRGHAFKGAPSINLSTALLDLCSTPRFAARACLDICSHLSSLLSSTPSSGLLLLLNLVKQLLFYAKLQFTKQTTLDKSPPCEAATGGLTFLIDDGGGGEAGIAVCQTYLAHVDLLHDLYMEDCGLQCSLEDLADPRKARIVRDKLVAEDRMKLANSVATKCAIESEPVWMAWGLRLLRLGDYDSAKEKLTKCIETSDRVTHNMFDRSMMLNQILEILAAEPDERDTSRYELHAMEEALKQAADPDTLVLTLPTHVPEPKQALSPARYMQCVYYLSRIGSPAQLIRFWLANGYLEDACRYIISGGLPESFFISEVLTHCLAFNAMKELFQCLPRIDPKGTRKTKYLVQTCKYLNEAHAFDLLLEMQEFMGDWCRAGQTCVKLFHIESNHALRFQYLKMAERHFSTAIKDAQQQRLQKSQLLLSSNRFDLDLTIGEPLSQTPATNDDFSQQQLPLSEAEMSKYFRKVVLQISVMEFLEQRPAIPENEELRKLSMFGSAKDKIAERLVVLAPTSDLGFRMMQEFRLAQGEIYSRAVRDFVVNKRKNELTALLKTLKGTIDHEEWDTVLLAIIRAFIEIKDTSNAEKYISKLFSTTAQIVAYRLVGLLKTAFVLAAKGGDVEEIGLIRAAALASNAKTVVQLCNAYLAKSSSEQKRK